MSTSTDAQLLERLLAGDDRALGLLMERHDLVVRYAVFRAARRACLADPTWLDGVASEAWMGFCTSIRQSGAAPTSLRAYLVRIARNRAVSALRRVRATEPFEGGVEVGGAHEIPGPGEDDPSIVAGRLEELIALRTCLNGLAEADRELVSQLEAVVDRRWRDAAASLGLAESTFRSRWKRVLERLLRCVEGRIGRDFAPGWAGGDKEWGASVANDDG